MPIVRVTRRVHFNAAHRLHNPALSDAENARLFGRCNSPNYHGHNYELDITVQGEPDAASGYVVDLGQVRDAAQQVLDEVDHHNLNLDVAWLQGIIPSTENLVVALWRQLAPRMPAGRLARLVLYETPRNWAEYTGEGEGG
jgi:6-pyruvoyltetrahydropterin/6-carboxytetrahydropterin synthase